MAEPRSTRGAPACWLPMSIPEERRMWLSSLAPFGGSGIVKSAKPRGMPTMATSSP